MDLNSDLCNAILTDDRIKVLSILESGYDVNQLIPWNADTEKVIQSQIDAALDSDEKENPEYNTLAINLAVIKGSTELVGDLLKAGARVDLTDSRGR